MKHPVMRPVSARARVVAGVASVAALAMLLASAGVPGATAVAVVTAQAVPQTPPESPEDLEKRAAELLDSLFERLAAARTESNAELLEAAVWQIWLRSGSVTVDLLMQQTIKAINDDRMDAALAILDSVVELEPGYAEGWNKRATVLYLQNQHDAALRDIERVLQLEPRHFGALSGRALIKRAQGDRKGALEAYRQALEIHPFLSGARRAVRELEIEVEGQAL